MFEAAGDITSKEIRAYREFHNDADDSLNMWDPENATMTQLRAYRNCAYMNTINGTYDEYRTQNSTPFSSRAPSRAGSSLGSRASSRANSVFSLAGSRPSSRASFIPPSRAPSSRASSPCDKDVIVISDSDSDGFPATVSAPLVVPKIEPLPAPPLLIPPPIAPTRAKGRKGKQKAASSKIQLTREEAVDEIIELSSIPSTWAVPRIPTAYRVDLSHALDLLKVGNRTLKIDRYLRKEDQDSWGGSGGHSIDALVTGLFPGQTEALKCRRSHLKCNGVWTCEFIDPSLFAGCERYEPDAAAMRELWKHELDANEREAASAPGIISRFNLLSGLGDVPEFPGDFNNQFGPAVDNDLGNLPTLPMPSSPLLYEPSVISTDAETLAPKKKRPRAPEVNEALIIEGSRPRTKSRRALGEQ
ncbi:hypothetical protein B0H14DRAFT_3563231 [Mycena olivaceomarginata]|nr:hypothetical protein B0H14DRAFT_3563231 [Mycena olivaceomarginata]